MTTPNAQLTIALKLVAEAMAGRDDRLGQPMALHSLRVGLKGQSHEEVLVGMLHDCLEEAADRVTEADLRERFPDEIVNAVMAVSKDARETYALHVERVVSSGELAMRVKLHDVEDNLDRLHLLQPYHRSRLKLRSRVSPPASERSTRPRLAKHRVTRSAKDIPAIRSVVQRCWRLACFKVAVRADEAALDCV